MRAPVGDNPGCTAAWLPDTQMMWSDCDATMALAAANTSRIGIGSGHIAPRVMGHGPLPSAEFRDYLRVQRTA